MHYFQDIVASLSAFWAKHGCLIITPYDLEKGAGTSNPETLLRALGPEPFSTAYIEPCRRPKDGRYGINPNRLQHYFQYQVILKPSPDNIVDLYLESLKAIGLEIKKHDIRFVHDDWENPTLGAWGLGWEVWIDGMEDTQFTFFQAAAGIPLHPITGEITYGIERLAMCLQGVHSIFDIKWNKNLTYGDIFHQNEIQWSEYNFEKQDEAMWMRHFEDYQQEAKRLVAINLPIPAYDFVLKASHAFNMLDAKGVISVSERAGYIGKIRDLTKTVAESYLAFRERIGFPLLKSTKITASAQVKTPSTPIEIQKSADRFVLEIGVEELPASFVPIGIEGLRQAMATFLEKESLQYSSLQAYGSPRRLAIAVNDLISHKASSLVERRGPSVQTVWDQQGNISQAGYGFFKSVQITPCSKEQASSGTIPSLEIRMIKGEPYLYAIVDIPAQSTAAILQEKLPLIVKSLEFPKMMRWSDHEIQFARPIRWILSLFGSSTIPFTIDYLNASNVTFGHRQRKPGSIALDSAQNYESALNQAFVLVDQKERESKILSALRHYESEFSLHAIAVDRLVNELVHLCEWPEPTTATFNKDLLDSPKEVLSSEMIEHQKYIPLLTSQGTLSNRFVFVADNTPTDVVKEGNVKVLTARLTDGRFLWKEDRKVPLASMREKLHTVTYQKSLGTIWDKTDRLEKLVGLLAHNIPAASLHDAQIASCLSKADLVSHVVGEFPHLQGIIGAYLAHDQGLPATISQALEEQYLPKQEDGDLPQTPCGSLLAIADKFDTLTGFFGISIKPTSSNDPYALRRQAIGIVRIMLKEKIHLKLSTAIEQAISGYRGNCLTEKKQDIISNVQSYIATRAKAIFVELGFTKEAIEAITATQNDDIFDAQLRLEALRNVQKSDHFAAFLEVLKRCLGQAEAVTDTHIEETFLIETSEQALHQAIVSAEKMCSKAAHESDWETYISSLLGLRRGIAALFDQVRVLSEDSALKRNRLALLARIINLASIFANPKKLVETVH